MIRAAALALLAALPAPASAQERVNLDRFLAGFETKCEYAPDLQAFSDSLRDRYTFEEGGERLKNAVKIPVSIRPAIAKATAENKGEWTHIHVPLTGTYRGLPVAAIDFGMGHGNGVWRTDLLFDAPHADVDRVIGKAVRRLNAVIDEAQLGQYVKIKAEGARSRLICERSS